MAAADEERAVDSAIETLVLNKYCVVTTLNTAVFRVVTTQYLSQGILGGGLPYLGPLGACGDPALLPIKTMPNT